MIGRRIYAKPDEDWIVNMQPCDYGREPEGSRSWYCRLPSGALANLGAHEVTEHEDGTITVAPSIRVSGGPPGSTPWHGFLERGIWREA